MKEITKQEMRKRLDVIIDLAVEIQAASSMFGFKGTSMKKQIDDLESYTGKVRLDLEAGQPERCPFNHALYTDKDGPCPVCGKPLNPDFQW